MRSEVAAACTGFRSNPRPARLPTTAPPVVAPETFRKSRLETAISELLSILSAHCERGGGLFRYGPLHFKYSKIQMPFYRGFRFPLYRQHSTRLYGQQKGCSSNK